MKLQLKAALSFLQYRVCDKVLINVGSGLLKVVKSARAPSCSSCDTSALSFLIPERLVNVDFVEGMRKQIKDDDWCLLAALLAISDKVILSPYVNLRHTDFSILRFLVNWTMIIFCQWSSVICNPVIKLNEQAQYSPFGIQTWFNKKSTFWKLLLEWRLNHCLWLADIMLSLTPELAAVSVVYLNNGV